MVDSAINPSVASMTHKAITSHMEKKGKQVITSPMPGVNKKEILTGYSVTSINILISAFSPSNLHQ